MGSIVFIDLRGPDSGSVFVFDKETGRLRTSSAIRRLPDGGLSASAMPGDTEDACLSLPIESLNFRPLNLPFADEAKIREVLPLELDNLVLGGTKDIALDFIPLGAEAEGAKIMAVYAKKAVVSSALRAASELGVEPRIVTSLDLGALFRKRGQHLAEGLAGAEAVEDGHRAEEAIRELKDSTVNLRRGDFVYTLEREKIRRIRGTAMYVASLMLILISADFGLRAGNINKETAAYEDAISKVFSSVMPGQGVGNPSEASYKLKAELSSMRKKKEDLNGVSPLDILHTLSSLDAKELSLGSVTIESGLTALKGEASSLSVIEKTKESLAAEFWDVKVEGTDKLDEGRITFTITMKEKTI